MKSYKNLILLTLALSLTTSIYCNSGVKEGLISLPSMGGTVSENKDSLGVNQNKGTIEFSLPLPELPGRGQNEASLSLSYNQLSGSHGSGLGIGWSFNIPDIKINEDLGVAIRGQKSNGKFYSQISFQGEDLIFSHMESDGSVVFLPAKSNREIIVTYHPASFSVNVLGRTGSTHSLSFTNSFDVKYPDGTREVYTGTVEEAEGDFSTSSQPFIYRWPLKLQLNLVASQTYDAVQYDYTKVGGRSYLKAISFAGGASRFEFETASLSDSQKGQSYKASFLQEDSLLYTRISAIYDGSERDQWCLAYQVYNLENQSHEVLANERCSQYAALELKDRVEVSSLNVIPKLVSIYRFAGGVTNLNANSLQEPAVELGYSDWNNDDLLISESQNLKDRELMTYPNIDPSVVSSTQLERYTLADYNQDSLIDLIVREEDKTKVYLGAGDLSQSFKTSLTWDIGDVIFGPDFTNGLFHFADINGDSHTDILRFSQSDRQTIYVYFGDGKGGYEKQSATTSIYHSATQSYVSADDLLSGRGQFIDLNMDGTTDYLSTFMQSGLLKTKFCYSRMSGEGVVRFICRTANFPNQFASDYPLATKDFKVQDLNGDQLVDIIEFVQEGSIKGVCFYPNTGQLYSLGEVDLFISPQPSSLCAGKGSFQELTELNTDDELANMWLVDINGDGITDLAQLNRDNFQSLKAWLGHGNGGFVRQPVIINLNETLNLPIDNNRQTKISDIDSDGQKEIMILLPGESQSIKIIDFNRVGSRHLPKSNLLTHVDFNSGLRYDIKYSTSSDEYIRDLSGELNHESIGSYIHFPAPVVKQLTVSEGPEGADRANVSVTEYIYHDPYYNPNTRKFQGFRSVETIDYGDSHTVGSQLTKEFYHSHDSGLDHVLAGQLKEQRIYDFFPHGSYNDSLEDFSSLNPKSALLHSLSLYARTQESPCGDSTDTNNYSYCYLREITSNTWQVVPRELAETAFINLVQESRSQFGVANPGIAEQCNTKQENWDNFTLSYEKIFTFDSRNRPSQTIETRFAAISPHGIVFPESITRSAIIYDSSLEGLGISTAIKRQMATVALDGSPAQIVEDVSNVYESHTGFLSTATTRHVSLSQDYPAELNSYRGEKTNRLSIAYDIFGNISELDRGLGVIERVQYSEDGVFALEMIDGAGSATTMSYDSRGRLQSFVNNTGSRYTITYDTLNRRKSITSDSGFEEQYFYKIGRNFQPNLTMARTRARLNYNSSELDWVYRLTAYNPKGLEIAKFEEGLYAVDGQGTQSQGVRVLALKQYNRNDLVVREWTPFQSQFSSIAELYFSGFTLDGNGIKSFDGSDVEFLAGVVSRYNQQKQTSYVRNPNGMQSQFAYFPWGMVNVSSYHDITESGPIDRTVCSQQISLGHERYGTVDENGFTHRFSRNVLGQAATILLAGESQPREFSYNNMGFLESVKIPGIRSEYYVYDELGRRTQSFIYDSNGALAHHQKAEYDAGFRPTSVVADGLPYLQYKYDQYSSEDLAKVQAYQGVIQAPQGLLTKVIKRDPNNIYDYETLLGYDIEGRVVVRISSLISISNPNERQDFVETYIYGPNGEVIQKTDPFGVSAGMHLSPSLRFLGADLQLPWQAAWEPIIQSVHYNPKGQISSIFYRSNLDTQLRYNQDTLMLEQIQSFKDGLPSLQNLALKVNGRGSLVEINDQIDNLEWGHINRSSRYFYNSRDELILAQWLNINTSNGYNFDEQAEYRYEYNGAGNLLLNTEFSPHYLNDSQPAQGTSLIPLAPHRSYDDLGQLVANEKLVDASYDALGQMTCAQTEQTVSYFGYDSEGRRYYKRVLEIDGQVLGCFQGAIFQETQAESIYPIAGSIIEPSGAQSFVFAGDKRLARVEHGDTEAEIGKWYFYLRDHLQSSDLMISADGTPVEQMVYRPYGSELDPQALSDVWSSHLSSFTNLIPKEKTHHRYTGQYLDDDTGLYYFGKRYYDPKLGRFTVPDPYYISKAEECIGSLVECNLYSYAGNNPMKYVDPTGEFLESGWDMLNVAMNIESLASNIASGDWAGAALDTGGLVIDLAATVIPGVPGGAGTVIKGMRKAEKLRESFKKVDKVQDATRAAKKLDNAKDGVKRAKKGGKKVKGGDANSEKTTKRPSGFRKKTLKDSWDQAKSGNTKDSKLCPDCGKEVFGNPHKNQNRNSSNGWDNDHQPKWKDRDLSNKNREQVLDDYNSKTRLRCRSCNRSDNQ